MYAFVIQSAAIAVAGIPISLCEGDAWDASDPVVKAYPGMFSDTPKTVKQSTPAPDVPRPPIPQDAAGEQTGDLQATAAALGIKVSKRWGESRLLAEIEKAKAKTAEEPGEVPQDAAGEQTGDLQDAAEETPEADIGQEA